MRKKADSNVARTAAEALAQTAAATTPATGPSGHPLSVALFTCSTLPCGSVVHTAFLADALHDAGCAVTVYALDENDQGFFRPLRANVRLVPAGSTPPSTADLVRQRTHELAMFLAAEDRAGRLTHDVFHVEDCLTANAVLDRRDAGRGFPVVRTVHHVERFDDPFLARCQSRSIHEATRCLTVSEATRRDVARLFGVPSARITNGVAMDRFRTAEPGRAHAWRDRLGAGRGPVVLAVGGVEERKNTRRTLRAFAHIREQHADAQLWILGGDSVLAQGVYRAAFERQRSMLAPAAAAAVKELGMVADAEVPAVFQAADVLCLPSLHEGFGLAALEALAAGLPVVASRRAPFTEFLDEDCATLVDPLSGAAIANGLRRALEAAPLRREAGIARAEAYSWARVAAQHIEQYRHLQDPTAGGATRVRRIGSRSSAAGAVSWESQAR